MKLYKKCVAVICTLILIMGLFPANAYNASEVGDNIFDGGDGSAENPYEVSTPEQLNAIRYNPSAHYVQIADIDLRNQIWETIYRFDGIYDGNGYKISNMSIVTESVSIANQGGAYNTAYYGFVGLNCGILQNINIKNCSIDLDMSEDIGIGVNLSQVNLYVGSITAFHWGGIVKDSYVEGNINVKNSPDATYVGGVIGLNYGATGEVCENLVNKVEINVVGTEKDNSIYCGGVVGESESSIYNCVNYGNVTAQAGIYLYCGGIVGLSHSKVESCNNYGNIDGTSNAIKVGVISGLGGNCNVGGITGSIYSGNNIKCINYGNISAFKNAEGICYSGGITGVIGDLGGSVINCYNLGKKIICIDNSAGRIAGAKMSGTISDCYSVETTLINTSIPSVNLGNNNLNGESLSEQEIEEILNPSLRELCLEVDVKNNPELTYSSENGYSSKYFNLEVALFNLENSISYEDVTVIVELSPGISFSEKEDVNTMTNVYGLISGEDNSRSSSYPIYITTTEFVNDFSISFTITAKNYEKPQIYTYSIPIIRESDCGINIRSSNVYVGEEALIEVQVLNDGSINENDYTWTSSNEDIISVVASETFILGDMRYFYATIKGESLSVGESMLTIRLSDGRSSSCLIKNLGSKPKQENPSYQVSEKKEGYDLLQDYGEKWTEAYNEYIESIKKTLKEYAGSDKGSSEVIITNKAKEMKENDSKSNSKFLNFGADFPKSWKDDAYDAMARFLYENTSNKMHFNSDTDSYNIVNVVFKALSNSSKIYEYGNVVMMVDCFQFSGTKLGSITCYNKKEPYNRYLVSITSTISECKTVIGDYYAQLNDLENAAIYNVYNAIAEDILGESISKFNEKWLKPRISKYTALLNEAGVGNLYNGLLICNEYYQFVSKITLGDIDAADKLVDTMVGLKFEDTTITDRLVKKAANKLNKAGQALHQAYIDYINGDLKENALQKWWRTTFSCPVSVSVWNSNGEQIGYAGKDDIWYTNAIYIEERADAIVVDSYTDDKISFVVYGTDYGIMGCSVEEYSEGNVPIGRLNFYDIPLEPNISMSFVIPDTIGEKLDSIYLSLLGGEDIMADEYISTLQDGSVMLNCVVETNDNISGDVVLGVGTYVRGDAIVLVAVPQDGHRFIGWYQNDILLATSEVYEFTAKEDLSLKAIFASEQEISTELEPPTEPEIPNMPEVPEKPEIPNEPEMPTEPEVPTEPEAPSKPEAPNQSDIPLEPDRPEVPNELEKPSDSDASEDVNLPDDKTDEHVREWNIEKITEDVMVINISDALVLTDEEMKDLCEKNKVHRLLLKVNNNISITFEKGTMNIIEGMNQYDFTITIVPDYTKAEIPSTIQQINFISKVVFNYSGQLPAEASIRIPVGTQHVGKTLYYTLLKDGGTFGTAQSVVVDSEGYITVKQAHCSSYVITTENPNTMVNAPKTGEDFNVLWILIVVIGISMLFFSKNKKVLYRK